MHAWEAGQPDHDKAVNELLVDLSGQLRRLARAEVRLAVVEMRRKGKRAGLGAGSFGVAAVAGLVGAGVLAAAAVLALAIVLPAWLAALIVGVAALGLAGFAALAGRVALRRAMPMLPGWAITSVQDDVRTIAKGARR
jgi:putative superfamily III holin-X